TKNRIHISGFTDGRAFFPDSVYTVAVNSYRGSGGGGHLTRGAGIPHEELTSRIVWSTDRDFRHYLIQYIRKNKPITPVKDNNWKVIPESLYEAGKARDKSLLFNNNQK
ncbi:MAG TPA: bifunctional metallophosphatase/5'-nucleotidase, partial [Bacteroidales bacterium]|nr:bifunctional metallophosphatase/5'-nucleotidase [Bacteroidales bacterium]